MCCVCARAGWCDDRDCVFNWVASLARIVTGRNNGEVHPFADSDAAFDVLNRPERFSGSFCAVDETGVFPGRLASPNAVQEVRQHSELGLGRCRLAWFLAITKMTFQPLFC